jgi:hypothetical protein
MDMILDQLHVAPMNSILKIETGVDSERNMIFQAYEVDSRLTAWRSMRRSSHCRQKLGLTILGRFSQMTNLRAQKRSLPCQPAGDNKSAI